MISRQLAAGAVAIGVVMSLGVPAARQDTSQETDTALRERARTSLRKPVEFYRTKVATEGGYHFAYAEDLSYITKGTRVTAIGQGPINVDGYEVSYSDASVITHYAVVTSGAGFGAICRRACEGALDATDARGAWIEDGVIGKANRLVLVLAAGDLVVTVGGKTIPVKENDTVEVFAGAEPPRQRIIRSTTFAENVGLLSAYLAGGRQ